MANNILDLRMGVDAKLNASTSLADKSTIGTISYAVDNQNLYIDALKEDKSTVERQMVNANKAYAIRDENENIIDKTGYGIKSFQICNYEKQKILQITLSRKEGFVDATFDYTIINGVVDFNKTYILKYIAYERDREIIYYKAYFDEDSLNIQDFPVQYYSPVYNQVYDLIEYQDGAFGDYSISIGKNSESIGKYSCAIGSGVGALGDYSFVSGSSDYRSESLDLSKVSNYTTNSFIIESGAVNYPNRRIFRPNNKLVFYYKDLSNNNDVWINTKVVNFENDEVIFEPTISEQFLDLNNYEIQKVVIYPFGKAHGDFDHVEGISVAHGFCCHTEGYLTNAGASDPKHIETGMGAHAEGYDTCASGIGVHAEGYSCVASGDGAHAEGYNTNASGWGAHAEGRETSARYWGHAEGLGTQALGYASHAEGSGSIANENYSHASGVGTWTNFEDSFVTGKFNVKKDKYQDSFILEKDEKSSGYIIDNNTNIHDIFCFGDSYGIDFRHGIYLNNNSPLDDYAEWSEWQDFTKIIVNNFNEENKLAQELFFKYQLRGQTLYQDPEFEWVIFQDENSGVEYYHIESIHYKTAYNCINNEDLFVIGNGTGTEDSRRSDAFIVKKYSERIIINTDLFVNKNIFGNNLTIKNNFDANKIQVNEIKVENFITIDDQKVITVKDKNELNHTINNVKNELNARMDTMVTQVWSRGPKPPEQTELLWIRTGSNYGNGILYYYVEGDTTSTDYPGWIPMSAIYS